MKSGGGGDVLSGMQVMCFEAKAIWNILVENTPVVKIVAKPRRLLKGPPVE